MAVAIVYLGLLLALVGMVSVARPLTFLGVRTRLAGQVADQSLIDRVMAFSK